MIKRWYESKMIWFGILEIATAVITASTDSAATWQSIVLAGLGAATITLRSLTDTGIGS